MEFTDRLGSERTPFGGVPGSSHKMAREECVLWRRRPPKCMRTRTRRGERKLELHTIWMNSDVAQNDK